MAPRFSFNHWKALANVSKHGVTFEEAMSAFDDPRSLTIPDPSHSLAEDRYLLLGLTGTGRLLVVAHAERGDEIRLISARVATSAEWSTYAQGS